MESSIPRRTRTWPSCPRFRASNRKACRISGTQSARYSLPYREHRRSIARNLPRVTGKVIRRIRKKSESEKLLQNLLHRHLNTRKNRRVPLRVFARLGLAQFHNQVEKIFGFFRFECNDKVLIVETERVGRIEFYAREFVANFDVAVHKFLAAFEGEEIPVAGFDEGVDEEEFSFAGNDVGAAFGGVEGIDLVDVHAPLGHGNQGVGRGEIG